ncbi:hypothetical protein LTR85_002294 [Meristemomyces frigidus]|nr:hypothetical protein LTR85_002294 [Meristemomyces frigidus]
MAQASAAVSGPPYIPNVAGVGGRPTIDQDIPALAVFLLIYLTGAATNMTIFQLNRRKAHRFIMSWAMFGFCMARVATCVLRIVWATRPKNSRVAIAEEIFTNAGVLVLYISTLVLCQRVLRATHPRLGWNQPFSKTLTVLYVLLVLALLVVISFTILSFYTLNTGLRSVATWIQRACILYMLLFNILSIVLLLVSLLLPPSTESENFGTGSMRAKLIILSVAVFFSTFIAGFRTGTSWAAPRPVSDPAWYDSKAAFYIITLGFEVVVIYLFLLTRFDRRFWVPNGSKKPGDYSESDDADGEQGDRREKV